MSFTRLNGVLLSLLIIIGVFLVIENIGELLHIFMQPTFQQVNSHHLLIGSATAVMTGLLSLTLVFLYRALAREGRMQNLSFNQLLADTSRVQEEWQQTFDTLPDLVSVHDMDFKIVKANTALCEFLGLAHEELIGRYCYQLFHDRDTPIDGCPHAKAKDIGHGVTMEIDDPHLGIPLLVTCSPFVDRNGCFAGSVHMARIETSRSPRHITQQQHFIPICASCKDIRDDGGNWVKIEDYVRIRFNGQLTHSICKKCQKKIYPEIFHT